MDGGDSSNAVALGEVLRQAVARSLGDRVTSCATWSTLAAVGFTGRDEIRPIEVAFARSGETAPFLLYYLVPWQPLYANRRDDTPRIGPQLVTVTEPALVFSAPGTDPVVPADLLAAVTGAVESELDVAANQAEQPGDLAAPLPEGLRLIRARRHLHYLELEVAVPGTSVVKDAELQAVAPGQMIRVLMVPDTGPVAERWLAPSAPAAAKPAHDAGSGERGDDDDSGSAVEPVPAGPESMFPDYQPKRSPDTILDYRGSLAGAVAGLPAADLEHLGQLIGALADHQGRAAKNPGTWVDGNMVLGADPKQYRPGDDELLVSELGARIAQVVAATPPAELTAALDRAKITERELTYGAISIRHVDAMGSGRFFYASAPVPTRIVLRP